jgi:NADPH2:quinone reductase
MLRWRGTSALKSCRVVRTTQEPATGFRGKYCTGAYKHLFKKRAAPTRRLDRQSNVAAKLRAKSRHDTTTSMPMRAIRIHQFGDVSNLKVEELPDPHPAPGEVKVQVRAASINPSDARNVEGKMEGTTLPRIPGRDFAGVIVEGPQELLGREVWGTGGDVGFTRDGSHAGFIVIPADAAAAKPANLSFEEAACVGVNFVTAYEGLVARAKAQSGETVLVTGAGGGVGSAVLQLGQALGAKLIAADRTPFDSSHFAGVELAGYVNTTDKRWSDSVREMTGGKGVNVVFDCVGGEVFEPALSTLGQLGRQVAITSVGGRRVSFDLLDFYHRRLTLLGVDSRALTVSDCARVLESLTGLFAKGSLKAARITKRGSLDDAVELYTHAGKGGEGKAVFVFA